MKKSLPELVQVACGTEAGLSYLTDPVDPFKFGQIFLGVVGSDPDRIRQYHDYLVRRRDVEASPFYTWALNEAEKGGLDGQDARVLHVGPPRRERTSGLLAERTRGSGRP